MRAALFAVSAVALFACLDARSVKYVGCTDAGSCEDASLLCCDGYCMSFSDCVNQKNPDAGLPTGTGGGLTGSTGGGGVTEAAAGGGGVSATGGGTGAGGGAAGGGGGMTGPGGGASSGGGSASGGGGASGCNATCTGCCDGNTCIDLGHEDHGHCGLGGQACAACDPMSADSCTLGICLCGALPACGAPDHCMGGFCQQQCNANSCPDGCCQNNVCIGQPSDAACGDKGKACKVCMGNKHCSTDPNDSDGNSDYSCR